MDGKRIRFGLVGLGRHGSRYARHLLEDVPGVELVAICRRNIHAGQELARARRMTFYADYRELISDERLDAVAVVLPPDLNAPICTAAAQRGLSFVVEKPLAHTLADADAIVRATERSGAKGLVAHTLRFDSLVQSLKGHLHLVGMLHTIFIEQHFEPLSLPWLDEPGRGGIILHTGIHSFDLLRFLTGGEVIQAYCEAFRRYTHRTEDGFSALLRMEPGALRATVTNLRTTLGRTGRIEVVGEKGILVGDHIHRCLDLIQGREKRSLPVPEPVPTVRECLQAFVAWVRDDVQPPVSLTDGVKALTVVDACQRSSMSGTPVSLGGG